MSNEEKIAELERRLQELEGYIRSLENPSTVPPNILAALKSLGL